MNVGPLIPMSGVPFIANVPGLGKPATITLTAARSAEFVLGLANSKSASGAKNAVLNITTFANINPGSQPAGVQAANTGWRYPNIYQYIYNQSETVLSESVVTVTANSHWVDTGLSMAYGQQVYVDSRADGSWSWNAADFPFTDANGITASDTPTAAEQVAADMTGHPLSAAELDTSANPGALIGYVGSTAPEPQCYVAISQTGLFLAGDTMLNYAPPPGISGHIWLRNNDNCNGVDVGTQIVRIIITQKG